MIINSVIQTILLIFLPLGNNGKNISLTEFANTSLYTHHNCTHNHSSDDTNTLEESQFLLDKLALDGLLVEKIVLDAGHGGKDHGCSGKNSKEKEVALDVVLRLGKLIELQYPDIKVIYTRKTDVFIPLHERARIANKANADLFISIHCNSAAATSAYGTETYVLGLHRADDNLDVVKRENSAILMEDDYIQNYDGFDPNSPETHIILSMIQNAYLEQSIQFANQIEHQFKQTSMNKSRGVKQAGFLVLRNTSMPSVLVELGFLSNVKEEKYLVGEKGRNERVDAIFRAFETILGKRHLKNVLPAKAEEAPDEVVKVENPKAKDKVVKTESKQEVKNEEKQEVGLIYRLQLGSSRNLNTTKQAAWSSIDEIEVRKEGDMYKYLTGLFKSIDDARLYKLKLEEKGIKDVFLVAYNKGERISIQTAKDIELSLR